MVIGNVSLLSGLVIAWALVTSILILLLIYRGTVGMHQEDQVFLSASARGFEAESAEATAKIARVRPYVWVSTVLSAALGLAALGLWLVQAAKNV